jgi:hypothetical protein
MLPPDGDMCVNEARKLLQQSEQAMRLARAITDPLTKGRLMALAAEYLAKFEEIERRNTEENDPY